MNRVEYISFLHKQNLNGRESEDELFEAGINAGIEETEELLDKFTIEFALWKETIMQDENGMYFSESRAQISRNNPIDINGLLEVFKRIRSETVA